MGHSDTSETLGAACPTGGYWIGKQNNPVRVALFHGGTHSGVLFLGRIAQPPIALGVSEVSECPILMGNLCGILHPLFIVWSMGT